ncbi:MAG: DUF2490 domain-containing protein [Phaeodactylibacter sp.]|uniref:DUF2490 domain-containing protein n=1 Tax=Phaeodactylibacter sp. TaxID=1940289 RepID=UPI0032F05477
MKRLLTGLLCMSIVQMTYAQSKTAESFFQFSKGFELSERWSADVRTELRLIHWEANEELQLSWSQLYVQGGLAYDLNSNWKLGATYRLSRRGSLDEVPNTENRFAQQISTSQRLRKYRLRERLLLEQRIFPKETRHRWRFRLALDYPLNGERLDQGEWYLNHQVALLSEPFETDAWTGREHRLYTGTGTLLPTGSRLEIGIEARFPREASNGRYGQRWVLRTNWSW